MSKENPDAIQMDEEMTPEEQGQALRTYENDILNAVSTDLVDEVKHSVLLAGLQDTPDQLHAG